MVERGGLENRYTRKGIGGSNPPLSGLKGSRFFLDISSGNWFLVIAEA